MKRGWGSIEKSFVLESHLKIFSYIFKYFGLICFMEFLVEYVDSIKHSIKPMYYKAGYYVVSDFKMYITL